MKHTILFTALLFLAVLPASAQRKERFNPDLTWNTVRTAWGVRIPMGSDLAPDGEAFSLNYTRRFANHWGWRTGFEYLPENTSVTNCIGLPVSIVFRTYTVGFKTGVQNALLNSAADVVWDGVMGYGPEQMRQDVVANFLFILFRRAEFFAGVTPGYIFGDGTIPGSVYDVSDGTQMTSCIQTIQLNRRFSLTADAGATLSIPLWRFSLDITPAFHYLVTNNFSEYHQEIEPSTGAPVGSPTLKPLRWQFSLDFGLSFLF